MTFLSGSFLAACVLQRLPDMLLKSTVMRIKARSIAKGAEYTFSEHKTKASEKIIAQHLQAY